MTPKLTDDQRQALDAQRGEPVFVFDEKRHATWVLVSLQEFQRVRPLFDEEDFPIRESYPLQEAVAKATGWDDPPMNDYDKLAVPPPAP